MTLQLLTRRSWQTQTECLDSQLLCSVDRGMYLDRAQNCRSSIANSCGHGNYTDEIGLIRTQYITFVLMRSRAAILHYTHNLLYNMQVALYNRRCLVFTSACRQARGTCRPTDLHGAFLHTSYSYMPAYTAYIINVYHNLALLF